MICDTCRYRTHACRHRISAVHELIEGHPFTECPYYEPQIDDGLFLRVVRLVLDVIWHIRWNRMCERHRKLAAVAFRDCPKITIRMVGPAVKAEDMKERVGR